MGKSIIELSDGNPGALMFLLELMKNECDPWDGLAIVTTIEQLNIKGTDLYVLYSDLGKKDISTVANICKKVPMDILKDACSRQDRSGVQLIEPHMSK